MIKRILKKAFRTLGYTIEKSDISSTFTMNGALARCASRGLRVGTVIDVGASNGQWTRDCMQFVPDAHYLMIEAQEPHRPMLEKLRGAKKNVDYVLAAAGNKKGKIYFDNSSLFGGLASETPFEGSSIEVPVVTIDDEVRERKLKGPYVVKLDTHGFEVPILEGARETLAQASLVIIEVYNYKLTDTSLRHHEMCAYMENLGFRTIEMVDLILRDRDHSFWQMDAFFIPINSREFQVNTFD